MPSPLKLDIRAYDIATLKDMIVSYGAAQRYVLDSKQQFEYLDSYLRHPDIQARTIVAETPYIDRDFLLDYAAYYVRCFNGYRRWCTRFHFFSEPFEQGELEAVLFGTSAGPLTEASLKGSYLGFMVTKPLPETVIGRTCLRTYNEEDGRTFPHVLDYQVNLFGLKLKVKSLPFQEQDTVAAACATSALWTAFHGTGTVFQHEIPAPTAITESAIKRIPTESRPFPAAGGLTDPQMAEAVRAVGLDPLVLAAGSNWQLKAVMYAYLRAGIPVLMNCLVGDYHDRFDVLHPDELNGHAITLVGFRLEDSAPPEPGYKGLLLRSSQVSKVYGHDDQVGPFARMEFASDSVEVFDLSDPEPDWKKKNKLEFDYLTCTWGRGPTFEGNIAVSEKALIPLPTTIRISFDSILETLLHFDGALEELRSKGISSFAERQLWDVYLITSNELKSEWLQNKSLSPDTKGDCLPTALPRFVWRVAACDGADRLVDFLFDPTDIDQGAMIIKVIGYESDYYDEFLRLADVYTHLPEYEQKERLRPHGRIWEHLKQLHEQSKTSSKAP